MKGSRLFLCLIGFIICGAISVAIAEAKPKKPKSCGTNVYCAAHRVFKGRAKAALKISWCESRHRMSAVGRAGELSAWQIHPVHFSWANPKRLRTDAEYAARVAFRLSRGGTNWRPWWICSGRMGLR